MIGQVYRGHDMRGLMTYLVSEGRHNEHTEPHLVAGDSSVMAFWGDDELDRSAAVEIARVIDQPRRSMGVEIKAGHVWHLPLSLRAEEGQISDATWAAIAHDMADRLGFTEASGKSPCRWVAVHHGQSKNGNDHVHLAVNLVREDGTKADVYRDYPRVMGACRELEVKYGLQPLEAPATGLTRRARSTSEVRQVERTGARETLREAVERRVRAYAASSSTEAEFVQRCRSNGLMLRPRFEAGSSGRAVGFSVAMRPHLAPEGCTRKERTEPVYFRASYLGKDLSLPQLQQGWVQTPQTAEQASQAWRSAQRGQPVTGGAKSGGHDAAAWEKCHVALDEVRHTLRSVPVDDTAAFARVARDSAGVLAAWSVQVEKGRPGPLAKASQELSRFARVREHPVTSHQVPRHGMRDAAMLALGGVTGGAGSRAVPYSVLLRQLCNLMESVHRHHQAGQRLQAARQVEATVREDLHAVAATLPAPPAGRGTPAENAAERQRVQQAAEKAGEGEPRGRRPKPVVPGSLGPHSPLQDRPGLRSPLETSSPYRPAPEPTQGPAQGPGQGRG